MLCWPLRSDFNASIWLPGGHAQTGEFGCGLDLKQLAPGDALEIAEARYRTAMKQCLGIGARERANHAAL